MLSAAYSSSSLGLPGRVHTSVSQLQGSRGPGCGALPSRSSPGHQTGGAERKSWFRGPHRVGLERPGAPGTREGTTEPLGGSGPEGGRPLCPDFLQRKGDPHALRCPSEGLSVCAGLLEMGSSVCVLCQEPKFS